MQIEIQSGTLSGSVLTAEPLIIWIEDWGIELILSGTERKLTAKGQVERTILFDEVGWKRPKVK